MRRFQIDRPLMVRRWRREWAAHGYDFGTCHCGLGIGTMRKHRPYESHPSSSCGVCCRERVVLNQNRRRDRRAARTAIVQGLRDTLQEPHLCGEPVLQGISGHWRHR